MPLPKNKKMPYHNEGRTAGGNKPPRGHGGPNRTNSGGGNKHKDWKDGNKNKGDKKNGAGGNKYFGAVGPYKGVKKQKVNRLVNGILKAEVRDLRHERQQAKVDYRRGLGDLTHVHDETAGYLNFLNGQTANMYGQQGQQIDAATAALQGQLGDVYGGAQQGVNSEMARLGITGAANSSGLIADKANAQSLAAISGANAGSTLDLSASNAAAMGALLQGMNQGSYMQGIGQNLNARNDAFAKVRNAVIDVKKSRKDIAFELMQQLQQTGWNQFLQLQQLKQSRKHR